jgi:hypothetical protein
MQALNSGFSISGISGHIWRNIYTSYTPSGRNRFRQQSSDIPNPAADIQSMAIWQKL